MWRIHPSVHPCSRLPHGLRYSATGQSSAVSLRWVKMHLMWPMFSEGHNLSCLSFAIMKYKEFRGRTESPESQWLTANKSWAPVPIEPSMDSYSSLGSMQACLATGYENKPTVNILKLHMNSLQDWWWFGNHLPEPVIVSPGTRWSETLISFLLGILTLCTTTLPELVTYLSYESPYFGKQVANSSFHHLIWSYIINHVVFNHKWVDDGDSNNLPRTGSRQPQSVY